MGTGMSPSATCGGRGQEDLERVVRVEHHVLAGPEAQIAQRVGQTIAGVVVLMPGEVAIAVDHRHLVGLRLGRAGPRCPCASVF